MLLFVITFLFCELVNQRACLFLRLVVIIVTHNCYRFTWETGYSFDVSCTAAGFNEALTCKVIASDIQRSSTNRSVSISVYMSGIWPQQWLQWGADAFAGWATEPPQLPAYKDRLHYWRLFILGSYTNVRVATRYMDFGGFMKRNCIRHRLIPIAL